MTHDTRKPGDRVLLNTGLSPTMIVARVDGHHVTCVWFDENLNPREYAFYPECLVAAPNQEK